MAELIARSTALGAIGVLVLVGCSKTIDEAKLENTIKDRVAVDLGIALASVSCPEDVKAEAGGTFQCTGTTESGESITFDVSQTSDAGDVTYDSKDIYVLSPGLTTSLQEAASASAEVAVTVACPKAVVTPGGSGKIECEAKATSGETQTIVVPIANNTADVSAATLVATPQGG